MDERKEKEKPLQDFSSFFYFEASADSEEADCNLASQMDKPEEDRGDSNSDDNDDVLSCNNYGSVTEFDGDDSDEEKNEEDEHKSDVYGMSYCDDDNEMQEQHVKSFVSFDAGQEFADEKEKNRLFWEACLAS